MFAKKKRILIIDDDPEDLSLMEDLLAGHRFECTSLSDPVTGTEMIPLLNPDLILLDLKLPWKNGFAILRELKEDPFTSKIPVVIISGLSSEEVIEKTQALGAVAYVAKELMDKSLVSTVKKYAA